MEDRKKDHIDLAMQSQVNESLADKRFYYEPFLGDHNQDKEFPVSISGKIMKFPIWVSSMTGGTKKAYNINSNLAKVSAKFGLGMGLGSCRSLLDNDDTLKDFNVREILGNDLPLYANLGIAQVEKIVSSGALTKVRDMINLLRADGLIIHVNPFQEWIQHEGDRLQKAPIETIKSFLDLADFPVMVKEVGQGFGPESMKGLLQLPLESIEFAAFGGTNFSLLELSRIKTGGESFEPLANIGHSAIEMVEMFNFVLKEMGSTNVKSAIVSGGVRNFLDGYYLINKINIPAVYGQASSFLKYAMEDYQILENYVRNQISGFRMANSFLRIR